MWTKLLYDVGDLVPIKDFMDLCAINLYDDDEGYGRGVILEGMESKMTKDIFTVKQLCMHKLGFTHVLWFNR